jgi:hypothetical protein
MSLRIKDHQRAPSIRWRAGRGTLHLPNSKGITGGVHRFPPIVRSCSLPSEVMVRPLKAINLLHRLMGEQLAQK